MTGKRKASTLKLCCVFFLTKYWNSALLCPWHSIYFQVMRAHVEPRADFQCVCQLRETDTLIWWTYYCDAQLSWWLRSASAFVSHVVNSRRFETSNSDFIPDSRTFGKTQNSSCLRRCLNCHVCADNEPHCPNPRGDDKYRRHTQDAGAPFQSLLKNTQNLFFSSEGS